ncbi:MAG: CARDB domain-containing protein, partial [Bacteroidota bacterium]
LNGMDIDAGATIINTGSSSTRSLGTLGFYLSTDSIIDQDDYLFGTTTIPQMSSIDRNQNSYNTGLCQDAYVPAGDYYLGLIIDPGDRINETDELDNTFLFPNGPHVTMNCAQTHPPNITLDLSRQNSYTVNGNEIDIYISLRNAGRGVTPGIALINYYLSTDSLVDTLDYLIGSSIAGPMGLGVDFFGAIEVDVCTLGIEIPDSNYHIGFLLDPYDEIAETDETDNAWRFNNGPHASILCPVPVEYELKLSTNPPNAGSLTGAGTYEENSQVEIIASPTSGFRFLNWSRDSVIVSSDSVFNVLMDDNIELIANFEMTTSLLDLGRGERIKLYPNPNRGLFHLSYPSSGRIENLRIFNSLGQLIWNGDTETGLGQIEIDISTKGSGIYWAQFRYQEKEYSLKFLKE